MSDSSNTPTESRTASPRESRSESRALDTVRVVSHTHWDREWYHGHARFRQRLVALVDALLADPGPGPFLLDGQAIVLRDYLDVRPERADSLGKALRNGRLEAGPWFVLADNLIPSGEAIVRNLEAGRRVLERFGATAPLVAYCPDTFGHPAAMPTIANGFGMRAGVVWRGAGGVGHSRHDAFVWQAADGSTLPTTHLPPDGYEFGSALPRDFAAARVRWSSLKALFDARAKTGLALVLNGADHHARQPELGQILERLQAVAGDKVRVVSSGLQEWGTDFERRARAVQLPSIDGELRNSYGYTWTLGGTLATRAHQKRNNAHLERGLLRDVEPWLAVIRLRDAHASLRAVDQRSRLTMAQLPALLNRAWEDLLETHPHDTLCGCSTDDVARAMDARQVAVADQGRGLREAALQLLLGHDPIEARDRSPHGSPSVVVVRNRIARDRGGLAHITIRERLGDVPVGPGSGSSSVSRALGRSSLPSLGDWPLQRIARPRTAHLRRESPQHYPDNDLVAEHRVLAWVPPVPGFGLLAGEAEQIASAHAPTPVTVSVAGSIAELDNGLTQVSVEAHGRVTVVSGERLLHSALQVTTASDIGDSYTPMTLVELPFEVSKVEVREHGPLRAAVAIVWRAVELIPGEADEGPVRVTTLLRLSAGSPAVECEVIGFNARHNHRVRLTWHTDVEHGVVHADAAFGPVLRAPIEAPSDTVERVPDGQPLHRWLSLTNNEVGATMISDGLAEVHVSNDSIALTLLRGVSALSKSSIAARPGHAGWPVDTPESQCEGAFRAKCALLLHGAMSDATLTTIRNTVDEVLLPLVGETWIDLELPPRGLVVQGIALHGDAFEASAVTLSQRDERAVILRAVNLTQHEAYGAWHLPDDGPWIAQPVRLDESPLGEEEPCGATLNITAGPRAVTTWRVRRATH